MLASSIGQRPNVSGWFLYEFANATINVVPKWRTQGSKQSFHSDALPGVVHAKAAPCYVGKFHAARMSRGFAKVVWARYKADGTDLCEVTSLTKQRTFVRSRETEPASKVPEKTCDDENSWDYESIVTAEDVASSCCRGKLRDVRRVCEDGGEAALTTIVEVVEFACEVTEAMRRNATLSSRSTEMEHELVEARAVKITMREQRAGAGRRMTTLKTRLN